MKTAKELKKLTDDSSESLYWSDIESVSKKLEESAKTGVYDIKLSSIEDSKGIVVSYTSIEKIVANLKDAGYAVSTHDGYGKNATYIISWENV